MQSPNPSPLATADKPVCVIYAAKSTKDKHLSIPEQLDDGREMARENGWEVIGEFLDENFTGLHGERGPGLAAAIKLAKETAAERGCEVFIVAQHTSRFARGDDAKPGAAKALVELFHEWARCNVRGRLVENDLAMSSSVAAAVQGGRPHRVGAKVQVRQQGPPPPRSRPREAERRNPALRPPLARRAARSRGAERTVVERIYRDYLDGTSQMKIAAALSREGIKTSTGNARWTRAAVRNVLTNPIYIGKIRHNGEVYDGAHDAIISEETWNAVQRRLALQAQDTRKTKNAKGNLRGSPSGSNNGGGRYPKGPHLLTKGLLRRGSCGSAMVPRTSANRSSPDHHVYQC